MALPPAVRPYKRTEVFTEATVPPGRLKSHTTKPGTWGLIHVLEGSLGYRLTDPARAPAFEVLTPENPPGVVEPTILHQVELLGPARFFVEFLRVDGPNGSLAI